MEPKLLAQSSIVCFSRSRFVAALIAVVLALGTCARAGGPRFIAGASYFDPAAKGIPLTWAGGTVTYYTDQGDLSTLLPQATADAFVADAFTRWTGVSTAALAASQAGHLAENVSGQNVLVNPDGTISMPGDIQPTAVTTPVAVVYDYDGKVTDALLGTGASGSCSQTAVFGDADNFSTDGHLLHALVIMNGVCAQTADQLIDLKYRLVRVLGRVLGLDWSQANVNVFTRNPPWTLEDLNGLTIMHPVDEVGCMPITLCFPNPDQPKMDDRAAISRLYPVTPQNVNQFPGKQVFADNTARIHGSVSFADASSLAAQGMQGVNVVARWIDPSTGQPSRSSVATSVSGFLFRGNAGNDVNGFTDAASERFDRFGSDDGAVEGFFDLAGLEFPNGGSSAQYQLSVEAIDPLWSLGVGPYLLSEVQPSGTALPIIVSVSKGADISQDMVMQGSAHPVPDWFEPATYSAPASIPPSGEWVASLSGYGNEDFFWFNGQANRTLSVEITALDDAGAVSENKSLPVIGIWGLSDPPGVPAPAATPSAFNSLTFGVTRLDAQLLSTTGFRLGIADYRGDGRPDFSYHARFFYGDSAVPARASAAGGTAVAVTGFGFHPGNTVFIAGVNTPVFSETPNRMNVTAPVEKDGVYDIALSDPLTGASSLMTGALTFGAGPNDLIKLVLGGNPPTPVGGQAANPFRVEVVSSDGVTPVAGASVALSSVPAVAFSACGGTSTCTVFSDESGEVSSWVTPLSAQVADLVATLAPLSYNPAKSVEATLIGTSSALSLALVSPYVYIAQGATMDVALSGRVLSNGAPLIGRSVNWVIVSGSGSLTVTTAKTDSKGYSSNTLHVTSISSEVQISVCVEPGDTPCSSFYVIPIPQSALRVEPVSGSSQTVAAGTSFRPVIVRVIDDASPANPVIGATVTFASTTYRVLSTSSSRQVGDTVITKQPAPIILSTSQVALASDATGLASQQASAPSIPGHMLIQGTAMAGSGSVAFQLESVGSTGSGMNRRAMSYKKLRRNLIRSTE